jgi:hypothetical protein
LAQASAGSVEPATSLDINDIDTGLRAAAATMSRATAGIKYDEGRSGADYGLHQGQTVDEAGPDGRTRRVRILPPAFLLDGSGWSAGVVRVQSHSYSGLR